jgi:ATP-dependent RNA helicase DHX37/DHR1
MVGPPIHKAHNAKARKATSGSRKKGKAKKQTGSIEDTNVDILVTKCSEDKLERKEQLLQEVFESFHVSHHLNEMLRLSQLASQSESKWNSKKKRRLEKYIVCAQYGPILSLQLTSSIQEKKIKKEERLLLFEKLA